jgi:hypothetical protein
MKSPVGLDIQWIAAIYYHTERKYHWLNVCTLALQQQMDRLADTSLVGGERADATDHCLAGIVRLSNEVKDAASYIPTYDQRVYAEV